MDITTARQMSADELMYFKGAIERDMTDESPSAPYYYQARASDLIIIEHELYRREQLKEDR